MIATGRVLVGAAFLSLLLGWSGIASAGRMISHVRGEGDYGGYINIIVREVKVTPVRAHVGDVVTVDMVVEDQGDRYYSNVPAELLANGKVVARKLVTYGFGGEGDRVRRLTLSWDTRGAKPGEYRIEGQVFVWDDASPFDNSLKVEEPVVLEAAGAPFPGGKPAGGSATARDPRYKPAASAATGAPAATGGY